MIQQIKETESERREQPAGEKIPLILSPAQQVAGAICPACLQPAHACVFRETNEQGRQIRAYMSWCWGCDKGFEVEQFRLAGIWHIHRYRLYQAGAQKTLGDWQNVLDLPAAAAVPLVQFGPGGDFTEGYDPAGLKKQSKDGH